MLLGASEQRQGEYFAWLCQSKHKGCSAEKGECLNKSAMPAEDKTWPAISQQWHVP